MLLVRWPRLLSLLVGLWLVVSTVVFRTESSAGFNRLMIGIFVATCSCMALWAPWFRWSNTGFGVWLVFSANVLEHASRFLFLSTLAAGGALVLLSVVPTPPMLVNPRRRAVVNP